ncbi:MAG: SURF1 family protein [Gammaproteobacteria bacterium]
MSSSLHSFRCCHPQHQAAAINLRLKQFCFTPRWLPMFATLLLLPILLGLSYWQVQRAEQKRILLVEYQARAQAIPLSWTQLNKPGDDWQYHPVVVQGYYDNRHQFLLDNRSYQHQLGYQVLTPFLSEHGDQVLLVNRGWIIRYPERRNLPILPNISGLQTVRGILYSPPKPFLLSHAHEDIDRWPRRIQAIEINSLAAELHRSLYPFVVLLSPQSPAGFVRDWQPVTISPAKNWGYAVQWFALAVALIIIFIAVNVHHKQEQE